MRVDAKAFERIAAWGGLLGSLMFVAIVALI